MDFSVLLSLYYKEKPEFLKESLDSIFTQIILPNEIVLVEDGPLTSELDSVVEEYKDKHRIIKVIKLKENQGLGKALNEGLKHCTYDIVARMDTDDICKKDRFKKQLAEFEKDPSLSVVGSWIDEFYDNKNEILSTRKVPEEMNEIIKFGKKRNPMNHPVVMFKKSEIEKVGGYKPFYLFEDYYLWVRLILNGNKLKNIQESLLLFRANRDMFKRRGGWEYMSTEIRFQKLLKSTGFINSFEMMFNIIARTLVRAIPNNVRSIVYKKLLRK